MVPSVSITTRHPIEPLLFHTNCLFTARCFNQLYGTYLSFYYPAIVIIWYFRVGSREISPISKWEKLTTLTLGSVVWRYCTQELPSGKSPNYLHNGGTLPIISHLTYTFIYYIIFIRLRLYLLWNNFFLLLGVIRRK